jgi:beta-1,4-N-acetylglucosaminyltransferase
VISSPIFSLMAELEPIFEARPRTGQKDGAVDILLVCHSGGHLAQLFSLRAAWDGYSSAWVTDDSADSRSLLAGERVHFGFGPAARSAKNLVRNLSLARRLIDELSPTILVSTGAAMCVPFAWMARRRGIKVVYIESITRIEAPSLTCRLVCRAADRVYVQWPDLVDKVPGSVYVGSVLSSG